MIWKWTEFGYSGLLHGGLSRSPHSGSPSIATSGAWILFEKGGRRAPSDASFLHRTALPGAHRAVGYSQWWLCRPCQQSLLSWRSWCAWSLSSSTGKWLSRCPWFLLALSRARPSSVWWSFWRFLCQRWSLFFGTRSRTGHLSAAHRKNQSTCRRYPWLIVSRHPRSSCIHWCASRCSA